MFNFLDPKLLPKIVCKAPAMDNYEAANLISGNYAEKIRGFIAYSNVKPPIEIEFEFICPINIFYVVLNTTVGSQKCSGIELFAKNSNYSYTSISKAVYDKPGLIFCNSRKYSKENPPECYNPNYHLSFFKSNTFRIFLNAVAIKIVIFRTEKSVPCLGSVQAWGMVSKLCSPATIQTISRITQKAQINNNSSSSNNNNTNEFVCPDDFKDDLTYELMTIPITLPSGKTIDQSTLDKYILNEKSFGRKAGDPFTGIKFTENLKPVLNVALKSRIDMFLLQHADKPQTYNLKRMLGSRKEPEPANTAASKRARTEANQNSDTEDSDLDQAVKMAKMDPNYMCFTSDSSEGEMVCNKCELKGDSFYEIPNCGHYFCRTCILGLCNCLTCYVCNVEFSKSDVRKCNNL